MDHDYLHLIVSSFGYDDYKIWVFEDSESFDDTGFAIETTLDFNKFIDMTKKDNVINVIVQHMDKFAEEKLITKRKSAVQHLQAFKRKPKVSVFIKFIFVEIITC